MKLQRSWWQDEKKEVVHNTKEGEEVLLRKEDEHGRTADWIELYWGISFSAFPTFPNTALISVLHEILRSQSLPVDLSHDPRQTGQRGGVLLRTDQGQEEQEQEQEQWLDRLAIPGNRTCFWRWKNPTCHQVSSFELVLKFDACQ